MRLTIDDKLQDFTPIKTFRELHQLPATFGIALFEPKDFTGLAAIDKGGSEMKQLRQGMMNAIPETYSLIESVTIADNLQAIFRNGLYGINDVIGLKVVEVEYAVAGFGDVLKNWLYALIRAQTSKSTMPAFQQIYGEWLDDSTRISQQKHPYQYNGTEWQINIINNAYGRVGLRVDRENAIDYVQDSAYACPAEGYMATLLMEISNELAIRLASST